MPIWVVSTYEIRYSVHGKGAVMSVLHHSRTPCALGLILFAAGSTLAADPGLVTLDVAPYWSEQQGDRGRAEHVAMRMPIEIDLLDQAIRELQPDGTQRLTLQLESHGALFMSVKFSSFVIPEGASVTLIARDFSASISTTWSCPF